MSTRIIHRLEFVTVRYNAEWAEYSVRLNSAPRGDDSATYFTSDKDDAMHTAAAMEVEQLMKVPA